MKGLSIATKLRYIITAACFAAIVLTTGALLFYQWAVYRRDVSKGLLLRGQIFALNASAPLAFENPADAAEILKAFQLDEAVSSAIIFDASGNVFATWRRNQYGLPPISFRADKIPVFEIKDNQITIWAPIEMKDKQLGTLAFSRSLADLQKRFRESSEIALFVMLVALVVAFWLSHVLQRVISDPLLNLTEVARQVTENHDFTGLPETTGNGEVGVLSAAFRQMLDTVKDRDRKIREHASQLERKVAERTELLQQTNRDLQLFGDSVSHDLRTPLRSIFSSSKILEEEEGAHLGEGGKDCLARIQKNATRMEKLIDSLLKFSRSGQGPLEKVDVDMTAIVREVVEDLRTAVEGRSVDLSIAADMPHALAEPALIRQVWANLLGNAVKFTRERNPAQIEVSAQRGSDDSVTYAVKDNGAGFDMQFASKLFNVFERLHSEREFEGFGIGLATVQRILQRHGGRIWAEAAPGRGATFFFTVPCDAEAVAPDPRIQNSLFQEA